MKVLLRAPLSIPSVGLICCSAVILGSPFVGMASKILFLGSSMLFGNLHNNSSLFRSICFLGSLLVGNTVLSSELGLYAIPPEMMHYTFLTINLCSVGLFLICKEIGGSKLLEFLYGHGDDVWKIIPEVNFLDSEGNVLEHGSTEHKRMKAKMYDMEESTYRRDLRVAVQKGEFVKTDLGSGPDGEHRMLQTTIRPITTQQGVVGFYRINMKVHLPQNAVHEIFTSTDGSENAYKELFGQAMDHSRLMLDPEGNIISWNPGVERVKGYTRDEILNKHVSMFYTAEDQVAGRPQEDMNLALTEGKNEWEGWMVRKDGELYWASVSLTSVRDNDGRLLGFSEVTRDYTDKKRSLDKLRQTEEKYHLLVSSVTDYTIIMLDREGIITTWNAGAQKINGYRAKEVIGRHFSLFYDEEGLRAHKPERELELATKEGRFEEEGWRVRKDGTRFWASVVLSTIYNTKHEVVGFSKVTRDITDKKITQAALRASEERFQMLISSVKDYAIVMLDTTGRIATWNTGVFTVAGYTAEDIIGRNFAIFYTKEDEKNEVPRRELEKAIATGRYETEGWRRRKDGNAYWADVLLASVNDDRGGLVGYSIIMRDMTEKKIAQEQLRNVEERFQLLISSVRDYAIFMLDTNGYIISWNTGAQRIKGYSAEEAIGKHFSIVYTKQDCAVNKPQRALGIATSEGRYEDEGLRVRKDGTTFWANVVITAVRDHSGKLVGFSKVTRDVTEKKQTEIKLIQAKQAAEAASLAKQSFLAMMSHEIRTPLHAVITLSQLLLDTELTLMQRDYLDTIHSSSKQLLGIINDILDFSKIESGKLDLAFKPFNLRQCVEETLDLVLVKPHPTSNGATPSKQLDVVYIMNPGTPENIIGDCVRVRQVLVNYLSNAIKFTEKGEIEVRIAAHSVDPTSDKVTITFSVRDTGIGIHSPKLDELFQPFHQLGENMTSRVYGGTGLGLAISKKLSQLMGGDVWVESEEGIGSTFFFNITVHLDPSLPPTPAHPPSLLPPSSSPLPLSPPSPSSRHHSPRTTSPLPSPPSPSSSLSVLILDDSAAGGEALVSIMRLVGAKGVSTQDVYQALEWVTGGRRGGEVWGAMMMGRGGGIGGERAIGGTAKVGKERKAEVKFDAVFITRSINARHVTEVEEMFKVVPLYLTGTPTSDYHALRVPYDTPRKEYFRAFLPKPFRMDAVAHVLKGLATSSGARGTLISSPPPSSSSSPPTPPRDPLEASLRILVAEDNLVNQKVARRILDRLGYKRVEVVENGKVVLDKLEENVYDVILMDIQMPVMDGWTTTQQINAKYPQHKRPTIIAMTAYAYEHDQQKCAQLGMKAHIAKPVDIARLADLLRSCPPLT